MFVMLLDVYHNANSLSSPQFELKRATPENTIYEWISLGSQLSFSQFLWYWRFVYCTSLVHHAPREPGSFFSRRIRSFDMISSPVKCLVLRRKKEKKKCISRTWKKKRGNIFSAHYKLHLRTLMLSILFFLLFSRSPRIRILRHARLLSSVPEYDFWNLSLPTRYNVLAILYARSTYPSTILSFSRTFICLSHSRARPSTRSIYLFYFSVVHSSASTLTLFTVLRYVHSFLAGPWRKRAGCWPD